MNKILTPDAEPKAKTLTLAEGVIGHVLIQFLPGKGINCSGDDIDKIPPAALCYQLELLRTQILMKTIMEQQQQAMQEAAMKVQPAVGRPRSPFGG